MLFRAAVVILAFAPSLAAQFMGVSSGRLISTVDWVYTPQTCPGCDYDVSPNARRRTYAPALTLEEFPSKFIGFSTEVRLMKKGFAVSEPTLDVDYLEIPALLRLGAISSPRFPVQPFIEAGPALAIRVYCEVDYNHTSADCSQGVPFGEDWRVRQYDVSGILGAGVSVRLDGRILMAGARLDYGHVNINNEMGVPTKNRSSLVYGEFLWPVGRSADNGRRSGRRRR
jgi:hypothetical protein